MFVENIPVEFTYVRPTPITEQCILHNIHPFKFKAKL